METNSGEGQPQIEFELPQSPDSGATTEIQHDRSMEKGAPDENRVGKQQPPPAAPIDPAAIAVPAVQVDDQVQAADDTSSAQSTDPPASDSHVIEKVWVDKAKTIVAQTRDDPFIQKKQMSEVKADYIRKRFNKTIPVDDTAVA